MNTMQQFFRDTSAVLTAYFNRSKPIDHNVLKGRDREFFITQFLKQCFPKKYVIGNGQIMDTMGNTSREADIIVYNESMPLFDYGRTKYFLTDGVLAHIEVKSNLTSSELRKALCVTESVKKRDRGRKAIGMSSGSSGIQFAEFPLTIFSCIFAYEGIAAHTFMERLSEYYEGESGCLDNCVDMVCVLGKYTFILNREEEEKPLGCWPTGDDSLMFLFIHLCNAMYQKQHTTFDLTDYLGGLKETLEYKSIGY